VAAAAVKPPRVLQPGVSACMLAPDALVSFKL
jgi:hypothetical protein